MLNYFLKNANFFSKLVQTVYLGTYLRTKVHIFLNIPKINRSKQINRDKTLFSVLHAQPFICTSSKNLNDLNF